MRANKYASCEKTETPQKSKKNNITFLHDLLKMGVLCIIW